MRLGGWILDGWQGPEAWIAALQQRGYTAAVWPLGPEADESTVQAVAQAAQDADIVIAEVGAWHNNPLSRDETVRRRALAAIQERLALADRIGASCCVNVAGSLGDQWDGPDPADLADDTFDLVVESVRAIIDAVKPTRTFYTLETMPWMIPDSTESYARLIAAVDRPAFGVHFDPVNLMASPRILAHNGALIREFCRRFGALIQGVHAKDVVLAPRLTVHIDEVPPGQGVLDYRVLLAELERISPEMPVLMEHFQEERAYTEGAAYIRHVAAEVGAMVR
jgi:sugar phosphate isomerase/epimerase